MGRMSSCKPRRTQKRKPTGYNMYVHSKFGCIMKPGMTSRGVFSELAKQWKVLPQEEKCKFRQLAKKKNKKRH